MTGRPREVITLVFSGHCIRPLIVRVHEQWPWSALNHSGFGSANIQVNYHTHTEQQNLVEIKSPGMKSGHKIIIFLLD